jgi:hypothetical protein
MATFNSYITIRVRLPFITRIGTLKYQDIDFTINLDCIWYEICGSRWCATAWFDDMHLLLSGKLTLSKKGFSTSTHKIEVSETFDGIRPEEGTYKARVIDYK